MVNRRTFIKQSVFTAAALPVLSSCLTISTIEAKVPIKSRKIRKAAVLWYSQTGNTRKCGTVLARALEKEGIAVVDGDLREVERSRIADADLLVIGSPVFYYDTPDTVKQFIESLPDLNGIPVAAYVTFGGPEGNQHNAACSILEGLVQNNGVPVGLATFMAISAYSISFDSKDPHLKSERNTILPDRDTYRKVRAYAGFITSEVKNGNAAVFRKTLTTREFSTYFAPEWWTKLLVDDHAINKENCVKCGVCVSKCPTDSIDLASYHVNTETCVLCFGCINNCEYQAMDMVYNGKKVMGFKAFLEKNHLAFDMPAELES